VSYQRVIFLFFSAWMLLSLAESDDNLLLRLVVPKSNICVADGQITVELELRNSSAMPVVVDTAAIGTSVSVLALYSTEKNAPRFDSFNIIGDSIKPRASPSITLPPGISHRVVGTFSLDDDFFEETGFYQIQTDYFAVDARFPRRKRQVSSNWVIFQLNRCGEEPMKK
jgi:hypothetical protein